MNGKDQQCLNRFDMYFEVSTWSRRLSVLLRLGGPLTTPIEKAWATRSFSLAHVHWLTPPRMFLALAPISRPTVQARRGVVEPQTACRIMFHEGVVSSAVG